MISLFDHQKVGIDFLAKRQGAMLADEMGLGKSRQALMAAIELHKRGAIDRVLILCPAAVRYSWVEEMKKVDPDKHIFEKYKYKSSNKSFMYALDDVVSLDPKKKIIITTISYGLLSRDDHVKTIEAWIRAGNCILICDESSFVSNRTSKTARNTYKLAHSADFRWLLNGTPITQSPLDMWAQGMILADGKNGPLKGFESYYHFRGKYGIMGGFKMKQVVEWRYLDDMQRRFKPYVLRREKIDCLDLPPKTYMTRDVAMDATTWAIYMDLKKDALLALPDEEVIPEPDAGVRIMRLFQLTSGFVSQKNPAGGDPIIRSVGDAKKSSWLAFEMTGGELSSLEALIVWCRFRFEREQLSVLLATETDFKVCQIYGGQSQSQRDNEIAFFQNQRGVKRVLLGQPHAGGFGLTLTAAHTMVYLSNDFSYPARVQSEARMDRIGQEFPMTYLDVLARGPHGEETVDHHALRIIKSKQDLATLTCRAWRRILTVERSYDDQSDERE